MPTRYGGHAKYSLAAVMLAFTATLAFAAGTGLAGSQWGYPPESGTADKRYVRFDADGNLVGNGGCNGFRGKYVQLGDSIAIGPLAVTRMACSGEVMAAERSFLAALTGARSVKATHLELVLLDAGGLELLLLVRQDWD